MSACLFAAVLLPATICMSVRARWIVAETAACTLHKEKMQADPGGVAGKALGCVGVLKDRFGQVDRIMTVEAYNKITGKILTGLSGVYNVTTNVWE